MKKNHTKQIENLIKEKKYTEAQAIIESALNNNKLDFDALYYRAKIFIKEKNKKEIPPALEDAIVTADSFEQKIKILSLKGEWLLDEKEDEKVESIIKELNSYSVKEAKKLQARLYYNTTQFKLAVKLYDEIGEADAYYINSCIQYGDLTKAQKLLDKLSVKFPDEQFITLYTQSRISLLCGDYKKAYDFAGRAKLIRKTDLSTMCLGISAFMVGNLEVAAENLEAISTNIARIYVAKLYEKKDETNKAIETYQKININASIEEVTLKIYAQLQLMKLNNSKPSEDFQIDIEQLSAVKHKDIDELLILVLSYLKLNNISLAQTYFDEMLTNFLPMALPGYLRQDLADLLLNTKLRLAHIKRDANIITEELKDEFLKFVGTLDVKQQVNLRIKANIPSCLLGYILWYQRKKGPVNRAWGRLNKNISDLCKIQFCLNDIDPKIKILVPDFDDTSFARRANLIAAYNAAKITFPNSSILNEFGKKIVTSKNAFDMSAELIGLSYQIPQESKPISESIKAEVTKTERPSPIVLRLYPQLQSSSSVQQNSFVPPTPANQITDEQLNERYVRFSLFNNAQPAPQHEPVAQNADLIKFTAGS